MRIDLRQGAVGVRRCESRDNSLKYGTAELTVPAEPIKKVRKEADMQEATIEVHNGFSSSRILGPDPDSSTTDLSRDRKG